MFVSRYRIARLLGSLLLAVFLVACTPSGGSMVVPPASEEPEVLVLASHDSFSISEEVLAEFETANNADVQYLALGDAGEALNKMLLSKEAPLADVMFGVDNSFLSRALKSDLFISYASPQLEGIADDLKLDASNKLLPVDFGYINLNADREWFLAQEVPLPQSLADLVLPAYKGLLVVQNPATSSPGLSFLLATIGYFGEDWPNFWAELRANDVLVTSGWSEAYFSHFTVGSGGVGNRPLVVSYSTSPPADVLYAEDGREIPASVNVNPPGGTFRQIEFVGIVKGTKKLELARDFVDFMLSPMFQEDIPLNMFVYPALASAKLPDLFLEFAEAPTDPAQIEPADIEQNREAWIEQWTGIMLH